MLPMMLALLAAAQPPGPAANWVLHNSNADDTVRFYYDPASISRQGDIVRVWEWQDRFGDSWPHRQRRVLWQLDCAQRTNRLVEWIGYGQTGAVVGSNVLDPAEVRDEPVIPGSIGSTLLEAACR